MDVESAYYEYDNNYLYLKLKCYDTPGKGWPSSDGRYKWFIDFEGNLYHSGENIFDAEYLLFVEDTSDDGVTDMYLLHETNGDNNFDEYEPWPPVNYANYEVTDTNVGGWRIVAPTQIEMYISWSSIQNPSSFWITWATDQANPNLDQGPDSDHVDEEQPIPVTVNYPPLASNLSSGATFNPSTRVFSWTPTSGQAGVYSGVHFEVSDGYLTDSEDITITVTSVAPPPVGGFALPITLDLGTSSSLFPQIGLASALLATVAATIVLVRRRKKTLKREH